ncbi:MAG TPA: glycoside hydrolase family 2 TIM barrel-domain containing protein [Prolixibacteraceae bacterium]|nr:glycoside hydrolase family 2 TIM barrel-domain containing protein [Prolixibacteraceae bacterium]
MDPFMRLKHPFVSPFRMFVLVVWMSLTTIQLSAQPAGRENFDAGWKFHLGDIPGAEKTGCPDQSWRILDLPHDWSIEGSFKPDNPATNLGASLPGGIGWYRKILKITSLDSKHRFIQFDGVYMNSTAWINGHLLGNRPYGYSTFEYDLTPYLREGDNLIAVKVDNSLQPNSRWYSGSGIYRHVWLTTVSSIHVSHWGTYVTTPKVSGKEALVQIETSISNEGKDRANIRIVSTILDSKGQKIATQSQNGKIEADSLLNIKTGIRITTPKLWSTEHPELYRLTSEIYQGNVLKDTYFTTFGIRSLAFRPDSGFFLNGKCVKILGVCQHHDVGCLGAAVNTRALTRQLEILKSFGCNGIRTSHNPPSPDLLDLCDKMGFLVMDEAFDVWYLEKMKYDYHIYFKDWHERDLSDMVLRDRNHPSIFMWSIGNEIPEKNHTKYGGAAIAKELDSVVKKYDKTRFTTSAFAGVWRADTTFMTDKVDVIGINYTVERYPEEKLKHPNGFFIASETTSSLSDRGIYHFPADKAMKPTPDLHCSSFDHRGTYYDRPAAMITQTTWRAVKETPYVAGMFVWTGFDYYGEPIYPYPCISSSFGIVDLCGFPKDVYYFYKSQWTREPVLHLLPHWNWKEGDTIDVVAYTNCESVKLYLNDKLIGEQVFANTKTTYFTNQWEKVINLGDGQKLSLDWKVPFTPGTLRAEGYKEGRLIATDIVKTAGDAAKIELMADRSLLTADGKDLSYITVRIKDLSGNPVPNADNLIHFDVTGEGRIAGVANGNPISLEPAQGKERRAFSGMCQVVIQSTGNKGIITLQATSNGLPDEKIVLKSN